MSSLCFYSETMLCSRCALGVGGSRICAHIRCTVANNVSPRLKATVGADGRWGTGLGFFFPLVFEPVMHNSWPVTLKSWIVTQRCRICRQSVITWLLILTPLYWYLRAKRQSEDKTSKRHLLGGAELRSQDVLINVFTSRWQCKVRNDFILSLDVICAAEWINYTSRSLSGVSFCCYKRSEPFLMFQ